MPPANGGLADQPPRSRSGFPWPSLLRPPFRRLDPNQVKHALRTGLAAAVTMGLTRLFNMEQGYWAVISVIIVMQSDIGSSLMAGWTRLLGTAVGAALGALTTGLLGAGTWSLSLAVFLTILFCSYMTVLHESFRLAGVTAAIVILLHKSGESPLLLGLDRFLEVALGILVALAASFLWPSRSREVLRHGLAKGLETSAALLGAVFESRMCGEYQRQRIFHLKEQTLRLIHRNRQLLDAARREPGSGRREEALASLATLEERIFEHLLTMDHAIENAPSAGFHLHLPEQLSELAEAIRATMSGLAGAVAANTPPPSQDRMDKGLAAAGERLGELRRISALAAYDLDEVMHFYSFFNAMREIARETRHAALSWPGR